MKSRSYALSLPVLRRPVLPWLLASALHGKGSIGAGVALRDNLFVRRGPFINPTCTSLRKDQHLRPDRRQCGRPWRAPARQQAGPYPYFRASLLSSI
jgi:hypothetical protein